MKFRCLDCQNVVRVARCASWRAARPKCMACGSPRLEKYTSTAREVEQVSEPTDSRFQREIVSRLSS